MNLPQQCYLQAVAHSKTHKQHKYIYSRAACCHKLCFGISIALSMSDSRCRAKITTSICGSQPPYHLHTAINRSDYMHPARPRSQLEATATFNMPHSLRLQCQQSTQHLGASVPVCMHAEAAYDVRMQCHIDDSDVCALHISMLLDEMT